MVSTGAPHLSAPRPSEIDVMYLGEKIVGIKIRKIIKAIIAGILSIPSALILFFGTLFIHLKIYQYLNSNEVTEIDHNAYLEAQVETHFMVATPIFYILCFWLIWRLFNRNITNA